MRIVNCCIVIYHTSVIDFIQQVDDAFLMASPKDVNNEVDIMQDIHDLGKLVSKWLRVFTSHK